MAPAKQEVAGNANQGRRANTHPGHFAGADVTVLELGRSIEGCGNDD